jgi:predicted amidohydrolase YtcJ
MDSLADANIVNYGRLVSGTLDTSDKTKILFFIVRDIESFRTIIKHIKENGYNNIMIHVNGDELFDLALKVFEEVKNMKLNENLL